MKVHAVEVIYAAHRHCLFTEWEACSDIDLIAPGIVARPRSYNIPTADNYCNSVPDVYVELSKTAHCTLRRKFVPTIGRPSSDDVITRALIRDIDRHH